MSLKKFKTFISLYLVIVMILGILPVNILTVFAGESTTFTNIGLTYTTAKPGSLVCIYSGTSVLGSRRILDSEKYTVKYTYNNQIIVSQYFEVPDNATSNDTLTCTIIDNETGDYEVRTIPIDDAEIDTTAKINESNEDNIATGKYNVGDTISFKFVNYGVGTYDGLTYNYSFYKDGILVQESDMEYSFFGQKSGFTMKLDQEKIDQMQGHFYTIIRHNVPIFTRTFAAHSGTTGYYYGDVISNFVVGDVNYEVKAVYNQDTNKVTATLYVNDVEQNGYEVKWYREGESAEIGSEVKTSSSYDYDVTNEDKGKKLYAKIEADRLNSNNWITSNEVEIPMNEDDVWHVISAKLNPETPQVGRSVYIQNVMVKQGEIEKTLPGWNYVKYEYSIGGGELQEINTNFVNIPSDAGGKELRVVVTGKGLASDGEIYVDSVELKAVIYDASMAKQITKVTLNNGNNIARPGDEMPIVVLPEDATYKLEKYENNNKIGEVLNPTEDDLKRLVTEDDIGKSIRYRAVGTGLFYNSNVNSNTVTVISKDTKVYNVKVVNSSGESDSLAINEVATLKVTDEDTGDELTLGKDFHVTYWRYLIPNEYGYSKYYVIDNSEDTMTQVIDQTIYDTMYESNKRLYVSIKGSGDYTGVDKNASIMIIDSVTEPTFTLNITSNTDPTKPGSVLTATVLLDGTEITPDKGGDWDYVWKNEDGDVLQEGGKTYTAKTEDVGKKVSCEIVELNNLKSNEIPVVDDEKPSPSDELIIKDTDKPDTSNPSTTKPGNTLIAEFDTNEEGIEPDKIIYTWYVEGSDEEIGTDKEIIVPDELVGKKVYVVLTYPEKDEWIKESNLIHVAGDIEETNTGECNVIVTQGQSFTVTIPAFVSLNGDKNTANEANFYTIVTADISGTDSITVEPAVKTFSMTERGGVKKPLTATIEGHKLGWRYAYDEDDCNEAKFESGIERIHKISVTKLSAGKWTGTFNWNITTTGEKIKDSEEYVKYRTYESKKGVLEYIEGSEVKEPENAEETPWD